MTFDLATLMYLAIFKIKFFFVLTKAFRIFLNKCLELVLTYFKLFKGVELNYKFNAI